MIVLYGFMCMYTVTLDIQTLLQSMIKGVMVVWNIVKETVKIQSDTMQKHTLLYIILLQRRVNNAESNANETTCHYDISHHKSRSSKT